ncbi:MAG: nuclear transport factor 2 family protein [bacterium]|nr:nuclear transport factor 2 family protein [bacterium]
MTPTPEQRDQLFRDFARALFKNDLAALYQTVSPDFLWSYFDGISTARQLAGPDAISAHLAEQKATFSAQHYYDVVYHHLPELTFMTFRVSETIHATGTERQQRGVEYYSFKDGKIATKDVYRKPG